jgi:ribose/xylose/arabinose/galactoside ABC-type transport system permease subunit
MQTKTPVSEGSSTTRPPEGPFVRLRSRLIRALGQKMFINLVALTLLVTTLILAQDRFLTLVNVTNVLRQTSGVIIVGVAVTLLMMAGCLDLSVGGVIALTGVIAAFLAKAMPLPLAFVLATGVGTLVGIVNGILYVRIGINAFIATLGTMYICQGAANLLTGGTAVIQLPEGYSYIGTGYWLLIPIAVWLALVFVLIFSILERHTLVGKYAVAVGDNKQAAFLSGIPVGRVQMLLYALSGTMAGVQGVLLSSRLGVGLPTVGIGFEFQVIVATILGGTSLMGGEGSVVGMLVGAVIVGVLNNGLNLLGVQSFWQTVVLGVVLVLAVSLDMALRKR